MDINSDLILGISTPLLLFLTGFITWKLKSKREELLIIEEKAREHKLETYDTIMEPLITFFTFTSSKQEKEKAEKLMFSVKYKKAAFTLTTFGSKKVIRSYNNLMQSFFSIKDIELDMTKTLILMAYLADFMIAVREDLYDKKVKLKRSDMLRFMITDIENYAIPLDKLNTKPKLYLAFNKEHKDFIDKNTPG